MATAWVSATAAAAARTTTTAAAAAEQYSGGGGDPSAFEFSWENAAVAGRSFRQNQWLVALLVGQRNIRIRKKKLILIFN